MAAGCRRHLECGGVVAPDDAALLHDAFERRGMLLGHLLHRVRIPVIAAAGGRVARRACGRGGRGSARSGLASAAVLGLGRPRSLSATCQLYFIE